MTIAIDAGKAFDKNVVFSHIKIPLRKLGIEKKFFNWKKNMDKSLQ